MSRFSLKLSMSEAVASRERAETASLCFHDQDLARE
jgi:hypothetical protein